MEFISTDKKFKFIKPGEVRTRFAPSPTGSFHIGSARTALFNYLFAKKHRGSFILRIEDTDIKRSDARFEKDIIEGLKWLGIDWDEGPIAASRDQKQKIKNKKYLGEYGPYRQSERKKIYKKYLEKLLKENKAYYCFCSEEELEAKRQEQMSRGMPPRYNGKCARLSQKEINQRLAKGEKSIIRFKTLSKKIKFDDMIRGRVEFDTALIGDFSIAKNLNTPLYNFAVVVDDFEMKITHVIRGEDLLPNTPKQILLQKALRFNQPRYGHLPLILAPDKRKLSKRYGAVAVFEYKKAGYLPETLINFLAFLGWNPGTKREIYSLNSLVKEFSIDRVQKGAAIFNIRKLDFLNGFYIRQKTIEKLTELCVPYLIEAGLISSIKESEAKNSEARECFGKNYIVKATKEKINFEYLKKIISIYRERLKKLSEVAQLTDYFFKDKLKMDKELLRWTPSKPAPRIKDKEIIETLDKLENILSKISQKDWNKKHLEKILMPEAEKFLAQGQDRGYLLWPLRVALTGKRASAGPLEIAEILGKNKVLERIKEAKKIVLKNA